MKKNHRWYIAIVVSLVMILSMLTPAIAAGHEGYENGVFTTRLLAGQDIEVGSVIVWNDGENLYVKYELNEEAIEEEWGITETHLHIANRLDDFPYAGRTRNPVPGQFDYQRSYDPPVTEDTYTISLGDLEPGDEIYIGAHAVVEKIDIEIIMEAPYGGSSIKDDMQGLRYDYTDVRTQRSNAETVLAFETGQNEANFFSLGFQEDRVVEPEVDDAWIIIEFDTPILNGPGDDLRIIEDTWGLPYPDETADVWVSQDGLSWEYLGIADNQTPFMNYHTISDFDLETVGLDYVRYVRVQDTSIRADFDHLFPGQKETLDGFDLNAVVALQDHVIIEEYDETAWGFGPRFTPRGNWATYFMYTIQEVPEDPASVFYGVAGDGNTGGLYQITVTDNGLLEEELILLKNVGGADGFSPNGLAYDEANHRLYYAVTKSGNTADLYFYEFDGEEPTLAGTGLPGRIYGATFGAEQYWFVRNGTDDMYTVSFDDYGMVTGFGIFEENFAEGKSFNFGDIALDAGELIIYGSTSFSGTDKAFFAYNLNNAEGARYQLITADETSKAIGLQLAFAEDENLYGHSTFAQGQNGNGEQEWFIVEKDGSALSIGTGQRGYNDLATGGPVK